MYLCLSWSNLWGWKGITSMNFPLSLPLFVGYYPLQSLEGVCEALRLRYFIHRTPVYVWFCDGVLERSRWKQLNLQQSFLLQLSAFGCVFFSELKSRDLVCLWGVSMQFCSWCVCGGRGIQSEGHVMVMSAMWMRGQGEAFGLLFAILALEPAAIPACWSIGLSVASNCLPWQLQTKKLKIAV